MDRQLGKTLQDLNRKIARKESSEINSEELAQLRDNAILNYYWQKLHAIVPTFEYDNDLLPQANLDNLLKNLPQISNINQNLQKIDVLIDRFKKSVTAKNHPEIVLDLIDQIYADYNALLFNFNKIWGLEYSENRGDSASIIIGHTYPTKDQKSLIINLNQQITDYFLTQSDVQTALEKVADSETGGCLCIYNLYARQFDIGNLTNDDSFQIIAEKFPNFTNLPQLFLFGDSGQVESAKQMLKEKLEDKNKESFIANVNSIVFQQYVTYGDNNNATIIDFFAELMNEDEVVIKEYFYRWRLAQTHVYRNNSGLIGDNLLRFLDIKKENPELLKQLREELNLYCLTRYDKEYLKKLPDILTQQKPYALYIKPTSDCNSAFNDYNTLQSMCEQLGGDGNVIAIEADSFNQVVNFIKKREFEGYGRPDAIVLDAHGNEKGLSLNTRVNAGTINKDKILSTLPLYLRRLQQSNIPVVLNSCKTGSTLSGFIKEHGLRVFAPHEIIYINHTDVISKVPFINKIGPKIVVRGVKYGDSKTFDSREHQNN